jgi:hypothetical protein
MATANTDARTSLWPGPLALHRSVQGADALLLLLAPGFSTREVASTFSIREFTVATVEQGR